ncbi:MAG: LuxR C-terminal-related transcriptional regulator [Ilumatobacteraceae bacterium]
MIAGIARGEDLVGRIDADHHAPLSAAIMSPGGCGKSAVLAAVSAAYRRAGVPVFDLRDAGGQPPHDAVVMFDDAHLAEPTMFDLVEPLVDSGQCRFFVAFRPWPEPLPISRLKAAIRRVGPILELRHLDRDGVERRAHAHGSQPVGSELDELMVETGGLPWLLDEVLKSWTPHPPASDDGGHHLGADLADRLRRTIEQLDPELRRLLHAVAVGADTEPETLARLLGIGPDEATDAVRAAHATGFLLPDGQVIPLVAAALERSAPPQWASGVRLALLALRTEQRRDGVPLARMLAQSGVRDGLVADVLVVAGDRHLTHEPAAAGALYDDAIVAGASPEPLAVRRAASAARAGRFDQAMQLIDPVLADRESPDLATAVYIAAAVMAHRGLLGRAAELYTWLGPERIGTDTSMATMALLATGQRSAARRLRRMDAAAPTMSAGVRTLMSDGLMQTIESSPSTALSTLMRATTLLESAEPTVLLADTPAAITTLVAIHVGDLDLAESTMRRAVDLGLGGARSSTRHRLLMGWVEMLRGRQARARQLLDDAVAAAPFDLSPRDELFASALRLGIARRTSDAPQLLLAWNAGRDALLRHPVDLFVLLPLGEFVVAAARVQESERISSHVTDARRLLHDLGEPVVWSTTLHWCGVQAAILNNRPADVEPHAAALVAGAAQSPFASALAAAGRAWLRILADDVDPVTVEAAARRLRTFGLAWDGSRLLGQAARHSTHRRTTTALLQAARSLQDPSNDPQERLARRDDGEQVRTQSAARRSAAVLSRREMEVAELLVQRRTYREIGAQLYISAKTVEHHVARIKQRIGARGRSDLLARLRVIVDDDAGST